MPSSHHHTKKESKSKHHKHKKGKSHSKSKSKSHSKSKSKSHSKSRSKSHSKSRSKKPQIKSQGKNKAIQAILVKNNSGGGVPVDKSLERLKTSLAKMRDRWQMMTSRNQHLDHIEKLSKEQIIKELRWYHSKEAFDLFMKWFDESVNWKLYYKKYPNLTIRPFLKN